ncbi:MAG: peptidase M3 [Alicyclobacillus sp.]|nr:peptidase M3 [Alicyclobacillus sp.]
MALPSRAEIAVDQTWNLSDLFPDDAAYRDALMRAEAQLAEVAAAVPSDLATATAVVAVFEAMNALMRLGADLGAYAMLSFAEDGANPDNQARMGRFQAFSSKLEQVLGDLRGRLVRLGADRLHAFAEEPQLARYGLLLAELAGEAQHRLGEDVESALAQLSSVFNLPSSIYGVVSAAEMQFAPVEDSKGEEVPVTPFYLMTNIEVSTDTPLRRRAYEALNDGLRPHQHTLATALAGHIQRDVALARMRGYDSVFDMLQNETGAHFMGNGVPPAHYFMVQDILGTDLAAHMRRYARLRQRVLGLAETRLADVKAPLESLQGDPLPFSDAREIITAAAAPLGSAYADILNRAFAERWIYRARNRGQANGAFAAPTYAHPFVFAPYGGQLYDVLILGHELGHAVHERLMFTHQEPVNARMSQLFSETPSTLMEHFIIRHLRATAEDLAFQRKLTMLQLFTYHHNFVTHHLEAEILRRLYTAADAGEPLSTSVIRSTSRQVLADFWGDDVVLDESADLYWMRQGHYYSGIYSYTYAVGLVGSTVISRRILEEGDAVLKPWLEALQAGGSQSALDLFAMVGLDMASPEPYREAVAFVGRLIDALEQGCSK